MLMEILNYLSIPSVENITKLLSYKRQSKSMQPHARGKRKGLQTYVKQSINKNIAIFLDIVMFVVFCQLFKIRNFL
jgi:hypothetical protein